MQLFRSKEVVNRKTEGHVNSHKRMTTESIRYLKLSRGVFCPKVGDIMRNRPGLSNGINKCMNMQAIMTKCAEKVEGKPRRELVQSAAITSIQSRADFLLTNTVCQILSNFRISLNIFKSTIYRYNIFIITFLTPIYQYRIN